MREKRGKKGEANLFRFGSSDPIVFKLAIEGSNVFG